MSARAQLLAATLGALALSAHGTALAQCSGGSACPPCTSCRVAPASGTNPTVREMSSLFDQIAAGPAVYGSLGWNFGSGGTIGAGPGWCGSAGRRDSVPAHFPCILLKAIYLTESSWRQFCSTNQTVISFDCGYGIAQVTSGMRRGDTAAYDGSRVASSPAYNVSVGAAILAGKWRASACVGSNDPDVIEHWYFATWGYNGFATKNNPNNPLYRADRPEFRTPGVSSAQVRGNYPYQELVWGYAHYPLTADHYTGIALAYPTRSEICASCASPTANISEPRGSHRTTCPGGSTPPPDAGPPDTGVRLDTGVPDTGRPDTGRADTGFPQDLSPPRDTAPPDLPAPTDTGSPAPDTGSPSDATTEDTAPSEEPTTPPGCACGVPASASPRGALAALLSLLAALVGRRRGARRTTG